MSRRSWRNSASRTARRQPSTPSVTASSRTSDRGRARGRATPRSDVNKHTPVALPGGTLWAQHNKKGRRMTGKIVHFEVPAKDTARAKKFYSSLFGYKIKDAEMPGMEYWLI